MQRVGEVVRLALLILLLITLSYSPQLEAVSAPFNISADQLSIDQAEEMVRGRGEVIIEFEDRILEAEEVDIDLQQEEIVAVGEIFYKQGNRELSGEQMVYDYGKQEGKIWPVEGSVDYKYLDGDELRIATEELEVDQARVTSCQAPEAHFELAADELTVYPNDLLIARGVEVYLFGQHVFSYPVYKYSLRYNTELTPIPIVGYNSSEGHYLRLDYEHFISPELQGDIEAKWTSRDANQLDLDYEYRPHNNLRISPEIEYHEQEGWQSELELDSSWDYGLTLDADLKYEDPRGGESLSSGEVTLRQQQDNLFWQLDRYYHQAWNYRPQLKLGLDDTNLGSSSKMRLTYSQGDLYFPSAAQEINRKRVKWRLWDRHNLTDHSWLDSRLIMRKSWFDDQQEYDAYQLDLDFTHELDWLTDIEVGWEGLVEDGSQPNLLTSHRESINYDDDKYDQDNDYLGIDGTRQYYDLIIDGHWLLIEDKHFFTWQLDGHQVINETEDDYSYYGFESNYRYFLSNQWTGIVDYDYRNYPTEPTISRKQIDVERDELDKYKNSDYSQEVDEELSLGFNYEKQFSAGNQLWIEGLLNYDLQLEDYESTTLDVEYRSVKEDYAHWEIDGEVEYDLQKDYYSERNLELTRVYDCMELGLTMSWLRASKDDFEREIELEYELKY
ncbi:MAG: hypothetical protein ACQEQI_01380 [Bacillota bacterium]